MNHALEKKEILESWMNFNQCNHVGLSLGLIFLLILLPSAFFVFYLNRKMAADLQARVGPHMAGPAGLLQPIADFLKLLQKEGAVVDSWQQQLWMMIHHMTLYTSLAALPLGSLVLLVDTQVSAFFVLWTCLVLALGSVLLGLDQATVPGGFGAIRVAAQTLSGFFPALVCLLCVGVKAGSFQWSVLAQSQGSPPWSWTVFSNPFETIAFICFVTSGLVLLGIPPLDGGMSIADIHGGIANHLSGRQWLLFRLGHFYAFFYWSVVTVVLFLGAWNLPKPLTDFLLQWEAFRWWSVLELTCLLSKTLILMLCIHLVARVNPRSRVDQVTDFVWKVLSPFSLIALIGVSLWLRWRAFT